MNAPARPDITRQVTRGAARLLRAHGYSVVLEMTFATGRRGDLVCIGRDGEIHVIEVKSGPADFHADLKWQDYLEYCDRFSFAVSPDFPLELLPGEPGLIIADNYGGEFLRAASRYPLAAARRKAVTISLARLAADRLHGLNEAAAGLFLSAPPSAI